MNRAWIPAGALASVSVAGLIALGPLTDSLGTSVSFPTRMPVSTGSATPDRSSVPVSVNGGVVGRTANDTADAALDRGGVARNVTKPKAPTTSDTGYVADRRAVMPTRSSTATAPSKPAVEPAKKVPKRQKSITGTGETNSTSGLAGSGQGTQGQGETSSTLAP